MKVYNYGNRKLFTLDRAHVMTIATSTKIVPNACIWYHLVILEIKSKPIFKWILSNWASHAHFSPFLNRLWQIGPSCPLWPIKVDFGFIQRIYYLFETSREFFLHTLVSLSSIDKWNQANNLKKRNSPLNTRVEDIRVEISFESFILLCVMCK